MGTVVPLVAQEGNKYILTPIMKAIAAIAATPNPIEATPTGYRYDDPYAQRHALEQPYEYYYEYGVAPAKHDTELDDRLTKREEYDEEFAPKPGTDLSHIDFSHLTKRDLDTNLEDLDTYLDAEADPR